MNPAVLQEARPQIDLDTRLTQFRNTIARRCANILHGCYTSNRKLYIEIPAVLTGVSFTSSSDQECLRNEIYISLLKLLGDGYVVSTIVINTTRRDTYTGTHQETYLQIEANIDKA